MRVIKEFSSSDLEIKAIDCIFEFITSFSSGGVIFSNRIPKITLLTSAFAQCRSYGEGGSIYIDRNDFVSDIQKTCFDRITSKGDDACFFIHTNVKGQHTLQYISATRCSTFCDFVCHYRRGTQDFRNDNFSRNSCTYSASLTSYYESNYVGKNLNVADNMNKGLTYRIDYHGNNYQCITKDSIFVNNNSTEKNELGCVIYTYSSLHTVQNSYFQKNNVKYSFYSNSCKVTLDNVYGDVLSFIGSTSLISLKNNTSTITEIDNQNQHAHCFQNAINERNEFYDGSFHQLRCLISFLFLILFAIA